MAPDTTAELRIPADTVKDDDSCASSGAPQHIHLKPGADLDGFRRAVRCLIGAGIAPDEVAWISSEAGELFGGTDAMLADAAPVSLPRAVAELIESIVCHRDPQRYALTYRLVWRAVHGERDILDKRHDPLVRRLEEMAQSVRRDPALADAAMRESVPASLAELNRLIAATPPFVPGSSRAVLGEGPLEPRIALVGEQPGDVEDREGRPFVGPAGQLLMQALEEVGLNRAELYVTNAVKHFKFVRRGERRIHQSPTTSEVKHYRWWLMQELDFVAPRLTVALGASAALALTGRAQSVTKARGPMMLGERPGFITVHPSYLLRLPDGDRAVEYRRFLADLAAVRRLAGADLAA